MHGYNMKAYASFFRMHFFKTLQYRTAALAGIITQFAWGAMEIMLFRAFLRADPAAFPMEFSALASYIWLQQAFLALFMIWFLEQDIFDSITTGNVAYELCRPQSIYDMWYMRSLASRMAKALLRAVPLLIVTFFLPKPYGFSLPDNLSSAIWFFVTCALGVGVVAAIGMLIYGLTFYTISPMGLRIMFASASEFLSGAVVPLPFLPDGVRKVVEILPFASMQDLPFRIYSGSISGTELYYRAGIQVFWLAALVLAGRLLMHHAVKKLVIQGG